MKNIAVMILDKTNGVDSLVVDEKDLNTVTDVIEGIKGAKRIKPLDTMTETALKMQGNGQINMVCFVDDTAEYYPLIGKNSLDELSTKEDGTVYDSYFDVKDLRFMFNSFNKYPIEIMRYALKMLKIDATSNWEEKQPFGYKLCYFDDDED